MNERMLYALAHQVANAADYAAIEDKELGYCDGALTGTCNTVKVVTGYYPSYDINAGYITVHIGDYEAYFDLDTVFETLP